MSGGKIAFGHINEMIASVQQKYAMMFGATLMYCMGYLVGFYNAAEQDGAPGGGYVRVNKKANKKDTESAAHRDGGSNTMIERSKSCGWDSTLLGAGVSWDETYIRVGGGTSSSITSNSTTTTSTTTSLLSLAQRNAHETFAGRSILVIGGSTSRDLAADFMQAVMPPNIRNQIAASWEQSGVQGFQLFKKYGDRVVDFELQTDKAVMNPLVEAGWNFTDLPRGLPSTGCLDCKSHRTHVDYVAEYLGGSSKSSSGVTFEFSWKPEIFSEVADAVGFTERYCQSRYDVVYIGRGLHDAVFKPYGIAEPEQLERRFQNLANLISCFPSTTLIILRTPYMTTKAGKEKTRVIKIASALKSFAKKGMFGFNRTVVIDGHLMTSASGHPIAKDGHHYDSRVAKSLWRLIFMVSSKFFEGQESFHNLVASNWTKCGVDAL